MRGVQCGKAQARCTLTARRRTSKLDLDHVGDFNVGPSALEAEPFLYESAHFSRLVRHLWNCDAHERQVYTLYDLVICIVRMADCLTGRVEA